MNKKTQNWRAPILFALCLLPFAVLGGWCTGSYALDSFPEELRQTVLSQLGGAMPLYFIAAVESTVLAFVFGLVGYVLSRAVGLMRPLMLEKKKLLPTLGGYSGRRCVLLTGLLDLRPMASTGITEL